MHSTIVATRLVALLAGSLFLAACGDNTGVPQASEGAAEASSETPAAPAASPSVAEMNEALTAEQVDITLAVDGQPSYLRDEDVLLFNIRVGNQGKTHLVGVGTKPILLGVLLLGPEGPDKAPGLRDFVVVPLPLIAPGEAQTVQARLPAEALDGQTVQFQLLQGGVSWFDGFGQAPLNLGAYSRCNGADNTLCDSAGTPITEL